MAVFDAAFALFIKLKKCQPDFLLGSFHKSGPVLCSAVREGDTLRIR